MSNAFLSAAETLDRLLRERYSCRGFLPDPLPREMLESIVSMALRTASWCNAQPWKIHVLSAEATDRARRGLLEHIARGEPRPDLSFPDAYVGVYKERRRECGWQLYSSVGIDRGDVEGAKRQRMENFRFFGAPHVAIVTAARSLGTYGAVDCGGFVSTLMLAARSLGVASIAQAALASYAGFWREHLALEDDRVVVCGLSLGIEDREHPANAFRTARARLPDAMVWMD